MAYDELDPIGDDRADLNAAAIQATFANIHRGKNKPAYKIKDFLLKWETAPRRPVLDPSTGRTQTLAEQQTLLKVHAAMHINTTQRVPDVEIPTEQRVTFVDAESAARLGLK